MNDASQSLFNQIDVTNIVAPAGTVDERFKTEQRHTELMGVLNDIAAQQKRQNELLTQLINLQTAPQRPFLLSFVGGKRPVWLRVLLRPSCFPHRQDRGLPQF